MRKFHLLFIVLSLPMWMMAQITVTSTADSGPGSLRQAVIDIPADGTIDFNVGGPILLTSGQINLQKNMTLDGGGAGVIIDAGSNGGNRIFGVNTNAVVNMWNIELQNANSPGAFGGAVEVSVATLNAANCTFRNNSGGPGGAVSVGFGTGNFVNCNFIDNSATAQGGALDINTNSSSTVANCLFYNNQSSTNGGAIAMVFSATATIVNNTISDNSAGNGGGVFQAGTAGDITLHNNIIANNTGGSPDFAQGGPSFTANNNLIGDATGSNITIGTNGNITGDPRFFNPAGGNYRLLDQSPAINAADASLLPTDILDADDDGDTGETIDFDLDIFPRIQACGLDIGAFEAGPISLYVTNTNDSGPGSLRAALECANSDPGLDNIFFDIDGGGAQTIDIISALPQVNDEGINIDGSTQPGYTDTPLITIDGNAGGYTCFTSFASECTYNALKVTNFGGRAIEIGGMRENNTITNNILTDNGNYEIFLFNANSTNVTDNLIGIDENGVPSTNTATAIWIQGTSSGNQILRNTIGATNITSEFVIIIAAPDNTLNEVEENFIGTDEDGNDYGNPTSIGVAINGGDFNDVARNVIANLRVGINNDNSAQENLFTQNDFRCNIDAAITIQAGGNNNVQPPVITEAFITGISGTAEPGYRVQLHIQSTADCPGTACQGLYEVEVNADGAGNWTYDPAGTIPEGAIVTALQIENTAASNTSAMSNCLEVTADPCDPDLDDPTITLLVSDVTVECSEGVPPILVNGVDIIASDGCDGDISDQIEYVGSDFDTQDCTDGTIQVITDTYRITDAAGNFAEVQWVQTRVDTEAPEWDDPTLFLSLDAECGDDIDALLAANLPTATDGCDLTAVNVVQGNSVMIFNCGNAGTESYFYEVSDNCGNTNPQQYQIDVVTTDNTPPIFTSGPDLDITLEVDQGTCEAAISGLSVTADDGCGSVTITNDSPFATSGDADASGSYPPGSYTIVFTAVDDCGNDETYTVNLTVLQPDPPIITGLPSGTITVACGDDVPVFEVGIDVFATDGNGFDITDNIFIDIDLIDGDCSLGEPISTQNYEYSVTDACGQIVSESFTIEIVDTQAPEWDVTDLTINIEAECGDDVDAILAANLPTATDACGTATVSLESATSGITCGNASTGTYIYVAIDECGNETTDVFTINVALNDTQAPTLTGVPDDLTIGCDDPFPDETVLFAGLAATDACEGDLTDQITILPPGTIIGCVPSPTVIYEYQFTVIDACGNQTSDNFIITVINDLSVDLGPAQTICGNTITLDAGNPGLAYEWSTGATTQTIDATTADTYSVTVSGGNGCCAIGEVVITGDTAPDATAAGGMLDCTNGSVQLMGSSTTPDVTYSWTGPNGFTSNEQNPTVTMMGTYTLTVTSGPGCSTMAEAIVTQDAGVPDLTATGGELTCNDGGAVQLTAGSTTPGVTYLWTDPIGGTTTEQNPITFNLAGTYTVVATAPNGCTAEATVEVTDNTTAPTVTATGGMLDCATSSVQLIATVDPIGGTFSWTGPDGFDSAEQNPIVTVAGDYMLVYTGANGCTGTAVATVTGNTDIPDAMATGGMLNCTAGNVQLMGSSTTADVTYGWTGPGGFTSSDQNSFVTVQGDYTLTVTALNGCTATATATVTQDANAPDLTATGFVITCENESGPFVLMANSTTPGVTYLWTGPDGTTTTEQNPGFNPAFLGTYTVEATAPNGCTTTVAVEVTEDTTAPTVTATGGELDCGTGLAQLMSEGPPTGGTYGWTGPDGFVSSEQNPTVNAAGDYTVTYTSAGNGCTAMATATVTPSTGTAPAADFSATTNELTVTFSDLSTGGVTEWLWDFGDGSTSMMQNPTYNYLTAGTYTVCLTVTNDCGNATICEAVTVTVTTTEAVTFSVGTVTGQPGEIIEIPVSVENFNEVVSFQKSMHVADPTVARLVGVNNFNLADLDNSDFNLADDETISSVWFTANGITLPDETVIYTIQVELLSTVDECTAVFFDGMPTFVEVGAVTDSGVEAVPFLLNAGEACILAKVDILGQVYRETGDPLDEVNISCTDQPTIENNADGTYAFIGVDAGQDYTIGASRNTLHVEGVTALDLALIQRHILNVQLLDSPYKIIAADVDISGLVSGIDLVLIQQLILNIITEFPDFESWRFVEEAYDFLNPGNPLAEAFPEQIELLNLNRDTTGNDFIAMKLGDVNNTAMGIEEPDGGNLNLVVSETIDENGSLLVSFRSADATAISAYQFDIWFDQYQMNLLEVLPGSLPGLNETFFGRNRIEEGLLTTLWYDPTAQTDGWEVAADEVLFTLRFAAPNVQTSLSERIQTNVATMRSAGYTAQGEALRIHTDFRETITSTTDPITDQVYVAELTPNPFADEATLAFYLPQGGEVSMELLDAAGKSILRRQAYYSAGDHRLLLEGRELPSAGMYYLVFQSGAYRTTRKVVLQR